MASDPSGLPGPAQPDLAVALARLDERVTGLTQGFTDWKASSEAGAEKAFVAAEKATTVALAAQKEAAQKAEQAASEALLAHNGLIRKMEVLVATFPTKESVAKDFQVRDERIGLLDRQIARAYGASAGIGGFAALLAAVALFMAGRAGG